MKRKISLLIVLVLLFSLFVTPVMAYADMNLEEVNKWVEQANQKIEKEISKAQKDVDKYMKKGQDDKIAERIQELIEKTEEISRKTIEKAEKHGVTVVCDYTEITIGNITILIDPLRIVGV